MNKERLKQAYDKMTPDSQSEKRMLGQILLKEDNHMKREFTAQPVKTSRWTAIPAFMALIAVVVLCAFAWNRLGQHPNEATEPTVIVEPTEDTADELDNDQHEEITEPNDHDQENIGQEEDEELQRSTKTVYPLQPPTLDVDYVDNCIVPVSFIEAEYNEGNGVASIFVEVYAPIEYDAQDINNLQVGDTIMIDGDPVLIHELQWRETDILDINGGNALEGYTFLPNENGTYCEYLYETGNRLQYMGRAYMSVSQDFVFIDEAAHKTPADTYTFEELLALDWASLNISSPYQAVIVIENDGVTQLRSVPLP